MRRNTAIRLVLAAVATTILAACAEMPTGPKAPAGTRFDGTTLSTADSTALADSLARTNHQGTQI